MTEYKKMIRHLNLLASSQENLLLPSPAQCEPHHLNQGEQNSLSFAKLNQSISGAGSSTTIDGSADLLSLSYLSPGKS